jgi:hypothetical protein
LNEDTLNEIAEEIVATVDSRGLLTMSLCYGEDGNFIIWSVGAEDLYVKSSSVALATLCENSEPENSRYFPSAVPSLQRGAVFEIEEVQISARLFIYVVWTDINDDVAGAKKIF